VRGKWQRQPLGEALDIASGQVDPMVEPYADMPHVGGENIESQTGRIINVATAKELGLTSGKYLFSGEDVLYSKIRPNLNKVAVPSFAGICSADIYPLRPKAGRLSRAFLAHLLRSRDFLTYTEKHSSRTNIPKVNRESLVAYEALLPPLAEQRRIADVLDRAEALRAKRRTALAKLDSLTQSLFLESFVANNQFPSESLDSICELITDGTHYTPTYSEIGVIFLSSRNVTSGYIDWSDVKFIPESLHTELHRRVAPKMNDILLAKNGTTGIAAIVDRDCVFDIYVSLALLRPSGRVLPIFLQQAINSPACTRQFDASLKGIGVPNLHLKEIRQTKIPVPPIELQREFARRIRAVEKLKTAQRASLAELDALFSSLQHRAFRGEL
jgi:type I restriction enzyme, S subunit